MIKKPDFYRKIPFMVLMVLLSLVPYRDQAQSVRRQCISSYGIAGQSASLLTAQTAGQPYNTSSCCDVSSSFLPGFLQPVSASVSEVSRYPLEILNLAVYPNPASGNVIIRSPVSVENVALTVTDISGKPLIREEIPRLETYTFNCSRWPGGIYFVTLSDRTGCKSTVKLIINK
jgi:hypothetical protein